MTDKELRKLSKADLLSLMLAQSKEMDRLKEELADARKQLEDRSILLEKSGSLADASLAIFHVLEDAQKAADLYLENVRSGHYQKDEAPQEAEENETTGRKDNYRCGHFRESAKPVR